MINCYDIIICYTDHFHLKKLLHILETLIDTKCEKPDTKISCDFSGKYSK